MKLGGDGKVVLPSRWGVSSGAQATSTPATSDVSNDTGSELPPPEGPSSGPDDHGPGDDERPSGLGGHGAGVRDAGWLERLATMRSAPHDRVANAFFYLLLATLTVVFFLVVSGLFQPIFWAALTGIVFLPVQGAVQRRVGQPSIAALLTLLVVLVVVLVPTLLVAGAVADQGVQLYENLEAGQVDPGAILDDVERRLSPEMIEMLARIGIEPETISERIDRAAVQAAAFIAGIALSVGQNVGRFSVMLSIMLYLLFFVLRDGERMLDRLVWALPIGDQREKDLFAKFSEVGRATLKGTLVVGVVQGILGGIIFAILDVQGAVFWGVVMTFLSILPAVGATLVWLPAAVILIVGGSWIRGLILLAFGFLVISVVDNVLRPILVGRDTKMPDWLILVSTLGGLTTFGVSGFVIGPIIAGMFLSVWTMFGEQQEQFATEAGLHARQEDFP